VVLCLRIWLKRCSDGIQLVINTSTKWPWLDLRADNGGHSCFVRARREVMEGEAIVKKLRSQ
jgi:hypothetical protein